MNSSGRPAGRTRPAVVLSGVALALAVVLSVAGWATSGHELANPHGLLEYITEESSTELVAGVLSIAGLLFGLMFVGLAAAGIRRRFDVRGAEGAAVFALAGAAYIGLTMATPLFMVSMTAGGVSLTEPRVPAFDVMRAVVMVTTPVGLGCAGIAALGVAVAAFASRAGAEGGLATVVGGLLIILTALSATDSSIDGYLGMMTAGSVIVIGYAAALVIAPAIRRPGQLPDANAPGGPSGLPPSRPLGSPPPPGSPPPR